MIQSATGQFNNAVSDRPRKNIHDVIKRVHSYLKEIETCIRIGDRWIDKLKLALAGLEFHASNLLRWKPALKPSHFRIRWNDVHEIYLRRRSGDIFIFHEIFAFRCYSLPDIVDSKSARVVVDLGANIGLTSLFWTRSFPHVRFVCVEPNPSNANLLRRNLSFLGSRLKVIEAAVSDVPGNLPFLDSNWSWGGRLVVDGPGDRSVRCLTFDQIMEESEIDAVDVLKVDIEGAERQLLSGRPAWLDKVSCVIAELHQGYSLRQFSVDLGSKGFTIAEPESLGNPMVIAFRPANSQPREGLGKRGPA